jgi:hypothetical protein
VPEWLTLISRVAVLTNPSLLELVGECSVAVERAFAAVSGSGDVGFLFGPPLIRLIAQQTSLRIALFAVITLSLLRATRAKALGEPSHAR